MGTAKKTAKNTGKSKRTSTVNKTPTAQKAPTTKRTATAEKKSAAKRPGCSTVAIERRGGDRRRKASDRRNRDELVAVERRQIHRRAKVNRRRQIDPTTCERDYSFDEIEFMNAIDDYKRVSGRMFPTCSEVLEVVKKLGYEKRLQADLTDQPAPGLPESRNSI